MGLIVAVLLTVAPFCLALGIILPLVRFETLYFFDQTPSLAGVISALWTGQDTILAIAVCLFSIVFPAIKLVAITAEAMQALPANGLASRLLPQLARWSLMDVLLVALVIVAAKTGGLAQAFSQPGLWFYLASALTAALAHGLVARRKKA